VYIYDRNTVVALFELKTGRAKEMSELTTPFTVKLPT
jgi:hypothetical protein